MSKTTRTISAKKRSILLILIDTAFCLSVNAAYLILSFFAPSVPLEGNLFMFLFNAALTILFVVAFRLLFGSYSNIWRFANTRAYLSMIVADALSCLSAWVISRCFSQSVGVPYFITVVSLTCLVSLAARFSYRLLYKYRRLKRNEGRMRKVRVAIIGAGQLGAFLVNELQGNQNSFYQPVCFIDVDKSKIGSNLCGLPVIGENNVRKAIDEYEIQEVIIAIASDEDIVNKIFQRYVQFGQRVKIYDLPVSEKTHGDRVGNRIIRDFSIEDLLFRKPLQLENASASIYTDATVLVTGGGGSIGSELCRQIADCNPKQLIIFDIYENNAYDIQQELIGKYGDKLNLAVEIGSVRDRARLECIFKNYRPDIVFHAAAHKHVPLMEHSGGEAIKNNVMGTYNTADMAEKYGASRFVLISTDKAVNPTNIMGASKRLCEMIVQSRVDSDTCFTAVRFGNVLGSNGSVIPLFRRQIESGGPITITDKRIIRYFMTIPEASQLVMTAGSFAKRGELFVLNMGNPVKIYDLAVNMIRMMGLEPEKDIKIQEIGLRPGEKLYEELLMKNENQIQTENSMIFIEQDKPYSRQEVDEKIRILLDAVETSKEDLNSDKIRQAVRQTVPTFIDPTKANKNAAESEEMKAAQDNG